MGIIEKAETLFDYLRSPAGASASLNRAGMGGASYAMFLLALSTSFISRQIGAGQDAVSVAGIVPALIASLLNATVIVALLSAWTLAVIDYFMKVSSLRSIFRIYCVSFAPFFLILPVRLILAQVPAAPASISHLLMLLVYLKTAHLMFIGIKESCSLSSRQAWMVLLLPFLVLPLVLIMFLWGSISFMYHLFV